MDLLVRVEYKRQALRRMVPGMSGISGLSDDSYFIVIGFLIAMCMWFVAPFSFLVGAMAPTLIFAETGFVVMVIFFGFWLILTVLLAPIGILFL